MCKWCLCSLLLLLFTCYPEEQRTDRPRQSLHFSVDTLRLDTLLSDIQSPSYSVRLYNPNPGAVHMHSLSLARGEASPFSFSITGRLTKFLENQRILGRDSLLLLVNITPISQQRVQPYEQKDKLFIASNAGSVEIPLRAFVQDIEKHEALVISTDTKWQDIPAQLIGKSLIVQEHATLTMGPGMQILFEKEASMIVHGHLHAMGTATRPIVFTSAEKHSSFAQVPGQWQGLVVAHETQQRLVLKYVEISNAVIGLRLGNSDSIGAFSLELGHSVLKNMSVGAIIAFGGSTDIYNSLIYNCKNYIVTHYAGGTHNYRHCTLSNYPSVFFRLEPSFYFTDYLPGLEARRFAMRLTIENSILWGELSEELFFASSTDTYLSASHNILRTLTSNIFNSSNYLHSTSLNFPGFLSPEQQNYELIAHAFGKNKGKSSNISIDIRDKPRDDQPDIGAYEYVSPQTL